MGSDTLPGTPGNQIGYAISEVKSGFFSSGWEVDAPPLGNGVMWLMSTEQFQAVQPPNFAMTFYYTFINTGPAVTGATMSCGVDNSGYIVLNGVKYPSTNVNLNLGYEGIVSVGSFTVNIPPGLNTLELRVVNMSFKSENNVWQNQEISNGGPTAAWLAITSGSTVLVKTTNKWRCTQFNYPAKFISPVSLADVGENAGLSRPYSLAALAGKVMYNNAANATTLTSPVSLSTAIGKTFIVPSPTSTTSSSYIISSVQPGWAVWDIPIPKKPGTYNFSAVANNNSSKYMSWSSTVSENGTFNVMNFTSTNVGGSERPDLKPLIAWTNTLDRSFVPSRDFPSSVNPTKYWALDFNYNYSDATYILTMTPPE